METAMGVAQDMCVMATKINCGKGRKGKPEVRLYSLSGKRVNFRRYRRFQTPVSSRFTIGVEICEPHLFV